MQCYTELWWYGEMGVGWMMAAYLGPSYKLAFEPWELKEHLAKTGSGGLYFSLFKKKKKVFSSLIIKITFNHWKTGNTEKV